MKKTLTILCLALALTGCATIEKRIASSIISRYVGIWTKDGATQNDLFVQSSQCIISLRGEYEERAYRACMVLHGWHLEPIEIK
jgi:hypothetical protein